MVVQIGGALAPLLADAMLRGQGDQAPAVLRDVEAALAGLPADASHERAAVQYVLTVVEVQAGVLDRAVRTASAAVRTGEDLGEPGWVANALGIRAVALERLGRAAEAVDDLVHAEWETRRTDDPGLRAWAHAGLGTAYEELRLFELAAPHYEACSTIRADPLPLPGSELVDELNLASLHGTWARELEMLGAAGPRRSLEIERLRAIALQHAGRAAGLPSDDSSSHHALRARLLRAQNGWHDDPPAWLDELAAVRCAFTRREDDEMTVQCTATIAAVLAAAGRADEAAAEAQRAVDVLGADADTELDRYVRWVHLSVQRTRGESSAIAGLSFGATVARGWWAHRDNKLEMMRAAISGYARYRTTDGDRQAAREDPLTGLGNRRAYDEWLAEASEEHVTLLVVDVDRLKHVNDTHGHEAGDHLLMAVARMLTAHTRELDLTLRLGGDEFVVVLRQAAPDDGERVAERIRGAVAELATDASRPFLTLLSASIGHASTHEGLERTRLLSVADERMYDHKRRQRELLAASGA